MTINERLDLLFEKVEEVREGVIRLEAKDYDERIKDISKTQQTHGERLARAEATSAAYGGVVGAFVGGLVSWFTGAPH